MHLLSFRFLPSLIFILIAPVAAENSSLCDRNDWVGQLAHKTTLCPKELEEPEEPKHHGKGPQCRPGITTCKDREHMCCNDFVCEIMCDPDEDDDEHEEEQKCGEETDKECSCKHACVDSKCQRRPLFATGKDDDGVCIMVAAKHVNGTSKTSIKAPPAKPLSITSIPSVNAPAKHDTTLPKASEQRISGTRKPSQGKPVPQGKSSSEAKLGTNSLRQRVQDSELVDFGTRYEKCSGGRMVWKPCEATETCLDIVRFKDEGACGGRCDGDSYCVQLVTIASIIDSKLICK
jgi:hypothetical protein